MPSTVQTLDERKIWAYGTHWFAPVYPLPNSTPIQTDPYIEREYFPRRGIVGRNNQSVKAFKEKIRIEAQSYI